MLVVMKSHATPEQVQAVCEHIEQLGFRAHALPGAQRTAIGITGNQGEVDRGNLEFLPGVAEVIRVSKPYKLASRDVKEEDTVIRFAGTDAIIGGGKTVAIVAGPCSIETREQAFAIADQVAASGAQFFRGGAFKPRTSPYAFQGLGIPGLQLMHEAAEEYGLMTVSEVMEIAQIESMLPYVDCFQVGARNMQNFNLLRELGQVRKPVLLKRGIAATIEELLLSSEYIMSGGNYDVILCERGIRTYETATRNTMDISAIPVVKKLSHLPIVADPSHGTGRRDMVPAMARAAVAAGADALLVEIHPNADKAASDAAQTLYLDQFARLVGELKLIASAVGRSL